MALLSRALPRQRATSSSPGSTPASAANGEFTTTSISNQDDIVFLRECTTARGDLNDSDVAAGEERHYLARVCELPATNQGGFKESEA